MATVTTSGIWTSINADVINKQGVGTNHASWGTPAPLGFNKPSSYQFDGVSGVQANLDGTEFKLGTFTHHNYPLNYMTTLKFGVSLKVTVTFDGSVTKEFNYVFDHYETPATGQADEVTFPSAASTETVTLGDTEYKLTITGFKQNGTLVSKFISAEARSNSADIFAKLEVVKKVEPPKPPVTKQPPPPAKKPDIKEPQPDKGPKPVTEEECRVKNVVNTSSLLTITLERLNRQSIEYLLEQIILTITEHCEKQPGPSVNITELTQQIELLNVKLQLIQKATKELDPSLLGQIEELLKKLLLNVNLGDVIQNIQINVDGRTFSLQSLLQVISTVDQVVNIQIAYGEGEKGDIVGATFILTDGTQIIFNVRTVNHVGPDRLTYIFETSNWKSLPAHFSLVFLRRTTTYKILHRTVVRETFDAIEQTNIVFDLCTQITKLSQKTIVAPPPIEAKPEFLPPPPFEPGQIPPPPVEGVVIPPPPVEGVVIPPPPVEAGVIPPPPVEQGAIPPPPFDFEGAGRAPDSAFAPAQELAGLVGKLVRLKSWKGDYLHRPDRPHEVTTWSTGIGNIWYVECVSGNNVRLLSWKGDYLQRAEGSQGATSGSGSEWAAEFENGKLKLKSGRGDYLHRPDTAHGVTTWSTGIGNEWTAEVISSVK